MNNQRLIPLSALQHFAFCPRQCALIHIEQVWNENFLTSEGQQLHKRVDNKVPETRKGIRYERGVAVCAPKLGLIGKLDLIEIELSSKKCWPVEYKRGKPKKDDWDRIQLCAQALCLEEMLNKNIPQGFIWYWQTHHREPVTFSSLLRKKTIFTVEQVKNMFDSGVTPRPVYEKKCKACSLINICNPKVMSVDRSRSYIQDLFKLENDINEKTSK